MHPDSLPASVRGIVGSGVAMSAVVAVLLNLLFHHTGQRADAESSQQGGTQSKPRPGNYRI